MSEPTHHSTLRREPNSGVNARLRRARTEDMDISLLRVGVYSVFSQSGQTYLVDVFERSCTCPDWSKNEPEGGCKHMRRVDLDIDAGVIPRPDGRLPIPEPRVVVHDGGTTDSTPADERLPTVRTHEFEGPFPEFDRYGQFTGGRYFRCRRCSREVIRRQDLNRVECP
jgi:hypothetical protein